MNSLIPARGLVSGGGTEPQPGSALPGESARDSLLPSLPKRNRSSTKKTGRVHFGAHYPSLPLLRRSLVSGLLVTCAPGGRRDPGGEAAPGPGETVGAGHTGLGHAPAGPRGTAEGEARGGQQRVSGCRCDGRDSDFCLQMCSVLSHSPRQLGSGVSSGQDGRGPPYRVLREQEHGGGWKEWPGLGKRRLLCRVVLPTSSPSSPASEMGPGCGRKQAGVSGRLVSPTGPTKRLV